ncbi:erythromycin esterase family protein [Sphaerisporangium sp. TRM90804]|uniref:erythromycin esterase family protein n=1 Tax=Sphaerisporangium sp. TRM90804 TaxID=3031113 RepID=UPI0024490D04|nr:erythromycin esterase family protein [Sphaerisporangium sp. TRM90804]MDH2429022.1 erythromycin esterase family protein [Sphaerisporangium sp. TRM90804]
MSHSLFRDRADAGRALGRLLHRYGRRDDVVVLGLPRGGVPVAHEVARALRAPLDVLVVRELGVPGQEDLAMGAVAGKGAVVLNEDVIRGLSIPPEAVEHVAEREGREIPRWERRYRRGRGPYPVAGKVAVVVDDGLAAGACMRAAVKAVRMLRPARVVIAVPIAAECTCQELAAGADEVVCATAPTPYSAADPETWGDDEVTLADVLDLLRRAGPWPCAPTGGRPSGDVAAVAAEARVAREAEEGAPGREALFELVGDAQMVVIGGSSHGTHEFHAARARMTRALIEERGFNAVAAQAGWPDAYRVNRYVHAHGADAGAEQALRGFQGFPSWTWRNTVVLDFVEWLRGHNARLSGVSPAGVGFYGLDVYGVQRAAHEVVACLERADPAAAARARRRFARFDRMDSGAGPAYDFAAACGAGEPCEDDVVGRLASLRRHGMESAREEGLLEGDELFHAELNAGTARSAEEYYRAALGGGIGAWNLRERHMAGTLDALARHLGRHGDPAKIVVWGTSTHLGDSRATEAGCRGETSLGRLARERHPGACRLIGLTTYAGTVTAADEWDAPPGTQALEPAVPGSVEELFHEVGEKEFLLAFDTAPRSADVLRSTWLERMTGAVRVPREGRGPYFRARVRDQFDAVVHIDETAAVEPLPPARGSTGPR